MADQVQQIYSFLKSQHLHYCQKWVIEAIEYYRSRDPNIPLQSLKSEILDQWKLNNLRDFNIRSLPPNLSSQEEITLPGKYAVQVEQMLDASQSCYSQFQKLQKVSLENIEATKTPSEWQVNIKPSRCLTFTLSDGVQEVRGMEYAPIKKLQVEDPELLPGFKILIIGPVMCRKGMILLKEENVHVLGGEVEAFSEIYKQRSIICRKLNIEDNNDDQVEEMEEGDNGQSEENSNQNDGNVLDTQDLSNLLSENDEVFMNVSLDPEIDNILDGIILPEEKPQVVPVGNLNRHQTKQTTLSSFLSQNVPKKPDYPITVNYKPFVYLKQIIESGIKETVIFTIKAVILTMKKKITIQNNNFTMTAIISDGSYAAEVEFSPEVLESLMGYSSAEIKALSRERARNSAVGDRLKKIFMDAQQKFITLNCLMDVRFSNVDLPCVVSLKKVTNEHLGLLKARKLQIVTLE